MTTILNDLTLAVAENACMAWDGAKRIVTGTVLLVSGTALAIAATVALLLSPAIWVAETYQFNKAKEGNKP